MGLYDDLQGVATGLLRQFKQGSIYHVTRTPGAGPAYKPASPTETRTLIQGAVARGVLQQYVAQGLALTGDLQVTVEAVRGAAVSLADVIEIDGIRYTVVSKINNPAAGTAVVVVLIVRR